MTKIEDFENAPIGATATHDNGSRAMKIDGIERCWVLKEGVYFSDEQMEYWCWTLDPATPTTAREALDLAWELAHEVKEGQVIPEGARFLEVTGTGLKEYTAQTYFKVRPGFAPIRTVEPLPDPEPDWIDAPAVLAVHESHTKPSIWGKHWDQETLSEFYQSALTAETAHWTDLRDVIPLYPKGQEA